MCPSATGSFAQCSVLEVHRVAMPAYPSFLWLNPRPWSGWTTLWLFQSPVHGHLGCLLLWAPVACASVNTVDRGLFSSSGCVPSEYFKCLSVSVLSIQCRPGQGLPLFSANASVLFTAFVPGAGMGRARLVHTVAGFLEVTVRDTAGGQGPVHRRCSRCPPSPSSQPSSPRPPCPLPRPPHSYFRHLSPRL